METDKTKERKGKFMIEAVYEAMDKERKNVLICGIEAHICVLQTAIDLKAAGYQPDRKSVV